jgi:uncharacterized protein
MPVAPSRSSRRAAGPVAVLLVLTLVAALAGCGGDDDDSPTTTEADEATTATTAAPGEAVPGATPPVETTSEPGADGDVAAASGNAPAAGGAGLDEPPGDTDRVPFDGFGEAAMSVTDAEGNEVGLCVLLALVEQQRQRGLMEVTDLAGYDGMLFAFPEDTESGFWMSNTPMPLSIAWFDAEGVLVSTADMAPCEEGADCPSYPPEGPYRFALEVPQGGLDALGVTANSRMAVGGACA